MFANIVDLFKVLYIPTLHILDMIEIVIITVILYYLLRSIKDTRVGVVIKGITILGLFYAIAYAFSFSAILVIFKSATVLLSIAIVVVFQNEIRAFLEKIGSKDFKFIKKVKGRKWKQQGINKKISDDTIKEITNACSTLSKEKTGALIVIENNIPLQDYVKTGITIDSQISSQLLINIFEKNTPLHDGAVIVQNDKISSATSYLPLSNNPRINKKLGTRHRAAFGISEVTDSITVVVSEETGHISVARGGKIYSRLSLDELSQKLHEFQDEHISKERFSLKKLLFNNIGYKIVSIVLSVLIWTALINISDPITTKTFQNIPITIQNENVIEKIGKTYTVSKETAEVSITDKRKNIESLSEKDISIIADMKTLSAVNSITLTCNVNGLTDEQCSIKDPYITVTLENLIETQFPIEIKKIGKEAHGCFAYNLATENEGLSISGPESIMKTIDTVIVEADVSGIKKDETLQATPQIYDKNGNIVNDEKIKMSTEKINIIVSTYKTKTVPIKVQLDAKDILTKTLMKSYETNVKETTISASDNELAEIDEICVSVPITIEATQGLGNNFTKNIKLSDYIENIYLVDGDIPIDIAVMFNDSNIKREMEINTSQITVNNFIQGATSSFTTTTAKVVICGSRNDVLTAESSKLKASVDLKDYKVGDNDVEVKFQQVSGLMFEKVITSVKIAEKKQ